MRTSESHRKFFCIVFNHSRRFLSPHCRRTQSVVLGAYVEACLVCFCFPIILLRYEKGINFHVDEPTQIFDGRQRKKNKSLCCKCERLSVSYVDLRARQTKIEEEEK